MATIVEALETALNRHQAGALTEAAILYDRVLAVAPDTLAAWHYSAMLEGARGRFAEAVARFHRAVALEPSRVAPLAPLADALAKRDDRLGAHRARLARARLLAVDAEAWREANLAALALVGHWVAVGDWRRALSVCRSRLVFDPADPSLWALAGTGAARVGDPLSAAKALTHSLTLAGGESEDWANLARAHRLNRDLGGAWRALTRALALAPGNGGAAHDMAGLALNLGLGREAWAWGDRCRRIEPGRMDADWLAVTTALYLVDDDDDRRFARHTAFGDAHLARLKPVARWPRPLADDPDRPLRVGFVSADWRHGHPVARVMEPILRGFQARGGGGLSIHLYLDVKKPDVGTWRMAALADRHRDIARLSDVDAAHAIHADGIDVLVFIARHFDGNRIALAALAAAPVCVSFIDVATSALPGMDYFISDRMSTPKRPRERFTERRLRLPHHYVSDLPGDAPDPGPPPMVASGVVTLGCFNNPAKLSDQTLDLWAAVMRDRPDTRLSLRYMDHYRVPVCRERVLARLAAGGVAAARVVFPGAPSSDRADHLALYRHVDIALDPFPYSGTTTTFEALVMGVPVVTLTGPRSVQRVSGSILNAVGLDHLIAKDAAEYGRIIDDLAADPGALARLRAGLRGRVAASALVDGNRKARELARLFRAVWRSAVAER